MSSSDLTNNLGSIDFEQILSIIRRQFWVVLIAMAVALNLSFLYILTSVPLYTASTDLLIDKGQSKLVDELASASGVFQDEAEMLSQVELLKSDRIARTVARQLMLADNEAFLAGTPSLLRTIRTTIGGFVTSVTSQGVPADELVLNKEAAAVAILQDGLAVQRIGKTYVLRLSYTAPDPVQGARIATAFGDAYLDDQLQAKYEATRRASSWLQDRIAELKQQSYDADLAVQKFRNDNGLIASGAGLVSQQQLAEITTQLSTAQAASSEAKAQLDQIESVLRSGRPDVVVNDALVSQTINELRGKYLDAARRETEISNKLGPDHVQVIRLKAEMREYERLILGELRRIAESYRSTYAVMQDRERAIEASLAKLKDANAVDNTTQVRLRELERESETFKLLYDNFLQRYQQTVQQQSFPITDARVITPASPPDRPSAPKKPLVIALFLALGMVAGGALAGMREYSERFFRVGGQVRKELDMEFLGYLPLVDPIAARTKSAGPSKPSLWPAGAVPTYVADKPMSAFAETLRNAKVAADLGLPDVACRVIGFVSCLPSEGKSSVSASLGNLLAMQGSRVLIIDGDIRNPGMTRSLERRPERGLIEVIVDHLDPKEVLLWDASGMLAVLPTVLKGRVANTSDMLSSARMAEIIAQFRAQFDYIIVDLPPIGPVVDAKAFAGRVDGFVFVIEWGKTSRQIVRHTISNNPVFGAKSIGVILNKCDSRKMKLYRSYGSSEYYASRYQSYYTS